MVSIYWYIFINGYILMCTFLKTFFVVVLAFVIMFLYFKLLFSICVCSDI